MNKRAYRKNIIKLIVIALIAIIIVAAFLFIGVKFHNHKLLRYAMKLRIPTIIVLTETSFKIPNWEDEYRNLFDRNKYYVFCSNNTAVGNNEVTIAIEKDCFNIEYIKSYLS